MDNKEQLSNQVVENNNELQKEDFLKIDPEKTFCERTTYLEFLLSNAKDDEEAEHIKATINDYLDLYNDHDNDEEITEE